MDSHVAITITCFRASALCSRCSHQSMPDPRTLKGSLSTDPSLPTLQSRSAQSRKKLLGVFKRHPLLRVLLVVRIQMTSVVQQSTKLRLHVAFFCACDVTVSALILGFDVHNLGLGLRLPDGFLHRLARSAVLGITCRLNAFYLRSSTFHAYMNQIPGVHDAVALDIAWSGFRARSHRMPNNGFAAVRVNDEQI
jgi:hypothetical protein